MIKKPKLRMHIVLAWDLSPAQVAVACSHASLGTYLTFIDNPLMKEWLASSFVKVIHQVNEGSELFLTCRGFGLNRVFTESSLKNKEVSVGFDILPPDREDRFKQIPLYNPIITAV